MKPSILILARRVVTILAAKKNHPPKGRETSRVEVESSVPSLARRSHPPAVEVDEWPAGDLLRWWCEYKTYILSHLYIYIYTRYSIYGFTQIGVCVCM